MSFQDAVRTCLQQKYADFNGRARRSEYWFFVLFYAIVRIVANIIDSIIGTRDFAGNNGLLGILVALALLVPGLAVGVRRLHDTGRSGWWLLIALIPLVGAIVLLVFFVQDSHADNQYGPNPKAVGGYEYGQPYQQMPPPAPPQY
jgi:uncharacterized membrane protein YhaH (DUF805 family)